MRIAFMGTPAFAVPALAALVGSGHEILAVYSQPPRPAGRGHKLKPSPVHAFAEEQGIEVQTPLNFKAVKDREAFAALGAEIGVVVAYGLILPRAILEAPALGCVNLHGSLLPRWRGAAPIQRAIMAGDAETGIQVMQMETGLDTGPVLMSERTAIQPDDTAGTLGDRLAHLGADLLTRALPALARGGISPQPQTAEGVTYAAKITPEEARIDWTRPAAAIDAHVRGLNPVPGAWTSIDRDNAPVRLKVHMTRVLASELAHDAAPGQIVQADANGIIVAAGDRHAVAILRAQRPGKAPQDTDTFLRGYALRAGQRLV